MKEQADSLEQVATEGEVAAEDRVEGSEDRVVCDCDENRGGLVAHDECVGSLSANELFVEARVKLVGKKVHVGRGRDGGERSWGGVLEWVEESTGRASGCWGEGREEGP